MDMQSSPVIMELELIVIPVEDCTCMPSVLRLELGALIFNFRRITSVQWSIATCIIWLLIDVKPLTTMLLDHMNVIDWNNKVGNG